LPGLTNLGWPAPYAEGSALPWLEPLLVALPMAIAVVDSEGILGVRNEAMIATAGPAAMPGVPAASLFVPEDRAHVAEAVAMVVSGRAMGTEVRAALSSRPDEKREVSIAAMPPGLGIAAMIGMRDIREQLKLEAQVAAATRMQAVGQLAGGIAHDFNNILTAVLALTDQLLDNHPRGDPEHDSLDQIRANGTRAAALVAQLLAFARQQPQRQRLLELVPLVEGLQPLLRQLTGKGVQLEIGGGPLRHAVLADPGQIEQVIVNLAVNARDAMGGAGLLGIRLRDVPAADVPRLGHRIMPREDHVAIEVSDTGSGISPSIAGKIFEPFFTTKPMGEGTGLGLSTVYGIVKQSNGYIFAEPNPDGGTVFCVYLPAVARPEASLAAQVAAPAMEQAAVSLAGRRLLLVEDEPAVRAVLAKGLTRLGLDVATASDATEALAWLESGAAVDVVLSDVMMPGIDGVELSKRARRLRPGLPVLLMSGFAEPPLHKAADAQGVGFISKPFAMADLMAAMGAALSSAG